VKLTNNDLGQAWRDCPRSSTVTLNRPTWYLPR